jgi:hypothetical protein
MAQKATFIGECQLCGRVQKLPHNLLAHHGYKVEWNMFNGICNGSKQQPYQLSCQLIIDAIPIVRQRITSLTERIAQLKIRTGVVGFKRLHERGKGYFWDEVEFIEDSNRVGYKHKERREFNHCLEYGKTPTELARIGDLSFIKSVLSPQLTATESYLDWCFKRVESWQLKPLIPIEPDAK